MVTEILMGVKCGLLAIPRTATVLHDALSIYCAGLPFSQY
jgi:hypothetical protein